MTKKHLRGRFEGDLSEDALRFSASVGFDRRLALEDIEGSIAHVRMLAARGIVSAEDAKKIEQGLARVREQIERGELEWQDALEDVHMNVEVALGDAGKRLHTARSRNDQVATDMRLWTRRACEATAARIDRFLAVLAEYRGAQQVTRRRLYLEALSSVLPGAKGLYVVDGDQKALVPWLGFDGAGAPPPAAEGRRP